MGYHVRLGESIHAFWGAAAWEERAIEKPQACVSRSSEILPAHSGIFNCTMLAQIARFFAETPSSPLKVNMSIKSSSREGDQAKTAKHLIS